nr:uncharacterized protein LOC115127667 isoform X2 [Oncorhynchus nerka]
MDSTSKGRSLPSVPEALNPVSMKQPSEPLGGRMGRGGGDLGADPALLMDKAAAQLAVTLQDSVLNQMASHGHSHERLKDLTSRMLNGDQDKLPKLCPPEPPILKGTEAPSSHPSPQRKATSPEIKLKITKMVSKGKLARFETFCGEGPNLPTEDLLVPASRAGRKRRLIKPKPLHKLASNHDPVPVEVSAASQPEAAPQQHAVPLRSSRPVLWWNRDRKRSSLSIQCSLWVMSCGPRCQDTHGGPAWSLPTQNSTHTSNTKQLTAIRLASYITSSILGTPRRGATSLRRTWPPSVGRNNMLSSAMATNNHLPRSSTERVPLPPYPGSSMPNGWWASLRPRKLPAWPWRNAWPSTPLPTILTGHTSTPTCRLSPAALSMSPLSSVPLSMASTLDQSRQRPKPRTRSFPG